MGKKLLTPISTQVLLEYLNKENLNANVVISHNENVNHISDLESKTDDTTYVGCSQNQLDEMMNIEFNKIVNQLINMKEKDFEIDTILYLAEQTAIGNIREHLRIVKDDEMYDSQFSNLKNEKSDIFQIERFDSEQFKTELFNMIDKIRTIQMTKYSGFFINMNEDQHYNGVIVEII